MPVDDVAAQAALDAILLRVQAAAAKITVAAASAIQRGAMSRLHSGYGVVSGTMRRSTHTSGPDVISPDVYSSHVGPGVIYARRFELGFVGSDSLGRVYDQKPRPYFKPAWEDEIPLIPPLAARYWAAAIRG
jgi:hypothetical protein